MNPIFDRIPSDVRRYFTAGNCVRPLFGTDAVDPQDIFARTRDLIHQAANSVQVEMYNIDHPEMVDLLLRRAHEGVKVQVIMDPPMDEAAAPRKAAIERLRAGGVDVRLYPVGEAASFRPLEHVKLLLVDGRRAVIGGMNWGTHSPSNHDFDVDVEGPAVDRMEWLFRQDWLKSGGAASDLPPIEREEPCGDAYVNLVVSSDDPHQQTLAKTVLRAIRNARKSVHAELFALTEYRAVNALIDAHERGLDVKIILHPLKIGDRAINERAFTDLQKAGVDVRWYVCDAATMEKMHAKTGLFDDDQVIVGSANWTSSGFNVNREADVEVLSRDLNASFERQFSADWSERTSPTPVYLSENRSLSPLKGQAWPSGPAWTR